MFFRAGIKGLFVLMPILGVGWVLGLFALNKGTIVFVYAFAIVNGFQVRVETFRDSYDLIVVLAVFINACKYVTSL